ncbi:MAG: thioredoxin family protein [Balneolaceae bacterium]
MAEVESTMMELGTRAPEFSLTNVVSGKSVSLDDFSSSKALLVMFICNHCPFVKLLKEELVVYANEFAPKGLDVVAISSNDVENYPDDSPDKMKEDAERFGYPFPYLYDETQEVAQTYRAACTPDFFLFDADLKLAYRGQFDDSRPKNGKPVTGKDLREATRRVLNGEPAPELQVPSIGCNIKWKPGNEPDYFA